MDYETQMANEAKKKKNGQLFGLIFALILLGGAAYFYYNYQQGSGAKKFEKVAITLLDSVNELYKSDKMLETPEDITYTFPDKSIVNFDERTLNGGIINRYQNGNVEFAIYNSDWCATKTRLSNKIEVIAYKSGECVIK